MALEAKAFAPRAVVKGFLMEAVCAATCAAGCRVMKRLQHSALQRWVERLASALLLPRSAARQFLMVLAVTRQLQLLVLRCWMEGLAEASIAFAGVALVVHVDVVVGHKCDCAGLVSGLEDPLAVTMN
mmetsp:Transcript_25435/g.46787  ORF Transcript_25435/g.46787 Transcript_25435/m.46787 type:complete len:128 (+) Transcript_25435:1016-1399(+)